MPYGFILSDIPSIPEKTIDLSVSGIVSYVGSLNYDLGSWSDDTNGVYLNETDRKPDPSTTIIIYDQQVSFVNGSATIQSTIDKSDIVVINGTTLHYTNETGSFNGEDAKYYYSLIRDDRSGGWVAQMFNISAQEGISGSFQVTISGAKTFISTYRLEMIQISADDVGENANIVLSTASISPDFESAVSEVVSSKYNPPLIVHFDRSNGNLVSDKSFDEIYDALSQGQSAIAIIEMSQFDPVLLHYERNNGVLQICGTAVETPSSNGDRIGVSSYIMYEDGHIESYQRTIPLNSST